MRTQRLFQEPKKIPVLPFTFSIFRDGTIISDKGNEVSLEEFSNVTSVVVESNFTLASIVYSEDTWPARYWKYLAAVEEQSQHKGYVYHKEPIESLEYPGFYLIPGFNRYLVTKNALLLDRFEDRLVASSRGVLGYYTWRMRDNKGRAFNRLRHRVLCMAFKPSKTPFDCLEVNHINGLPGDDRLENLELVNRSENVLHAYKTGLRSDNKPVQIRNVLNGDVEYFYSCSEAARNLGITETTVSKRSQTQGRISYNGLQYRFFSTDSWFDNPSVSSDEKLGYTAYFSDGTNKTCSAAQAAILTGLTRTSFLRKIRESEEVICKGIKVRKTISPLQQ